MLTKIPHWIVGEQRYTNQFETWQAMAATKQPARFCLYEDAFDSLDWTQDPAESWDELLRVRCIQLRQKYKNLKLLYSGGRDSHCILQTFIRNQIPIDELLIVNYSRNPVRSVEYANWISPMAHGYLQHNSRAKITTLTIGVEDYKKWYNETWSEKSSANTVRGLFQPSDYSWMIEQQCRVDHSSTGIMCGLEKPDLVIQDNKLFVTNQDAAFLQYFHNVSIMDFFYISPDLPELHLKQAWMIINYIAKHYPNADSTFLKNFQNVHSGYYDELAIAVGRGPAVNINAPEQNGLAKYAGSHPAFQVLKKIIISESPTSWNRYQENMNWFYKNQDSSIDLAAGDWWCGAKPLQSKYYFVCNWPIKKLT
jgi:hypothetical protein